MSTFAQNADMFVAVVKGDNLPDEDCQLLFELMHKEYTGPSCYDQFSSCLTLFREKKPKLFELVAKAIIAKHDSPTVRELLRLARHPGTEDDKLGSLIDALKESGLDSSVALILREYMLLLCGQSTLNNMRRQGEQQLLSAKMITGNTPYQA